MKQRTGALLLAAGLSLAVLTACGGNGGTTNQGSGDGGNKAAASGDVKAYCDAVRQFGGELSTPSAAGEKKDLSAGYQKVADVAPADIKDDWQTLADEMKVLTEGMKIDPEALATTDPADLEAQQKKIEESSKKVEVASQAIKEDTTKRCVNA